MMAVWGHLFPSNFLPFPIQLLFLFHYHFHTSTHLTYAHAYTQRHEFFMWARSSTDVAVSREELCWDVASVSRDEIIRKYKHTCGEGGGSHSARACLFTPKPAGGGAVIPASAVKNCRTLPPRITPRSIVCYVMYYVRGTYRISMNPRASAFVVSRAQRGHYAEGLRVDWKPVYMSRVYGVHNMFSAEQISSICVLVYWLQHYVWSWILYYRYFIDSELSSAHIIMRQLRLFYGLHSPCGYIFSVLK